MMGLAGILLAFIVRKNAVTGNFWVPFLDNERCTPANVKWLPFVAHAVGLTFL